MKTEMSTAWPVPQKLPSVNESEMVKWLTSGFAATAGAPPSTSAATTIPNNSVNRRISPSSVHRISSYPWAQATRTDLPGCGGSRHPQARSCVPGSWCVAEAGSAGADDGFGAVGDLKFGEDCGDVVADGFGADDEVLRDGGVRPSDGDQVEDFAFAGGQLGEGFGGRGAVGCAGEEVDDPACHGGSEDGLAGGDGADRSDDLVLLSALDEIAGSAGAHGGEHGVVVFEHGQHEDPGGGYGAQDRAGGVDAVGGGHVQVHDDDVGAGELGFAAGGVAVGRLGDDLDVGQGVDQGTQPVAHHRMVVDDDDPDTFRRGHGLSSGSRAWTRPPWSVGPAVRLPPSSAARSCIERRPTPCRHRPRPVAVLVTASVAIRYAATSTAAGSDGSGAGASMVTVKEASRRRQDCSARWRSAPVRPSSSRSGGRRS